MSKADIVAAGLSAVQAAQSQAVSDQLGIAYDGGYSAGVADQQANPSPAPAADPSTGVVAPAVDNTPFSQADVDAAVAAAVAPIQSQAAALQTQLASETSLEQADETTISQLKSVLSQIAALAAPSPAPASASASSTPAQS